ncbi:seminal metalloprotease 1 isoform X2 [Manduca sexta]|uniref:seminal metalloprotease 1 isoform X2 n=1 Tax=Manduca sexta TaxID=7130 RepID=UPI00118403B4|nr:seminal metalloprotease 1 isoform X2 [Manduca sexta]
MEWKKLLVVFIVISVDQCFSMSHNEIEDFKDYLKKTSQLDQILRKGSDPDIDYDEEESVSDHAWEDSGKFEGDLILNDQQRRLIVKNVAEGLSRNGLKDTTKRWPNNEVIYYIQGEHFNGDQIQAIQQGIDDIAQASCVKFRPYKKGDRDAVVIQGSRRGCFSQVGYQGGYQILNLSGRHPAGRGCFRHGTVVHELLHTLGFYHMQSSPDRDDYINVIWENILQPARHNFRKYNSFAVSDFGVGYDYDSVLHYSRRAFSANGQDTLVPKQGGADIGQRVGLSDKDTKKLNKMYCDADSDNPLADEDDTANKPLKKKSDKNKPFDGHGIGYHQVKRRRPCRRRTLKETEEEKK